MKILELRFKNLNSLYGEWVIDFSDPEYVANGIFALTGPTGAGKSTVLDAVCLALYGATPRLGKITKGGNEIMSRKSAECYAEVLFESQAGRFRCHWEQHRAKKHAEGALQEQEHQIADADSGTPIETKKSLVVAVIEEKTGMDFDRFTRSILLAQGGFDTFLKADIEQKSKILEQITGTGIYSRISQRVHERRRDEQAQLALLQKETADIGHEILEPEQEQALARELNALQKQEKARTEALNKTERSIAWLTTIAELTTELARLTEEKADLQRQSQAFTANRIALERAEKATSLEGAHARLDELRKQHAEDTASLETQSHALPALEDSEKKHAALLNAAAERHLHAKEALKTVAPLIQKIRSLDQSLAEQAAALAEAAEGCSKDATAVDEHRKRLEREQHTYRNAANERETIERYLTEHAQDEWLIGGLAGITEQLANLDARQKELARKETELTDATTSLADATREHDERTKRHADHTQALKEAQETLQQSKEALLALLDGRLLREYRKEKDTLLREASYITRITELSDYRAKLEDGVPCPLCGSEAHPFAEGNIPVPDEIDKNIEKINTLIDQAEEQEARIKTHEATEAERRRHLQESEHLQSNAANKKAHAEKVLAELKEYLNTLQGDVEEATQRVRTTLAPLGITDISQMQASSLRESLTSRLNAWQKKIEEKREIETKITAIHTELKQLEAVIDTQGAALTEKQKALEQEQQAHADRKHERQTSYGDKNPDEEEYRLNDAVAEAEAAEQAERTLHVEQQQALATLHATIASLKERIAGREPELKKAEKDLSSALDVAGFSDEQDFLDAILTPEERTALSVRKKELEDAQTDLAARQKDRETRLATETDKKVTDQTIEALQQQFREYEQAQSELRSKIAELNLTLNSNAKARQQMQERQTDIEAQKKECQRWEHLHELIGSADGKKYRSFAQGLTFASMVTHANRQLVHMTDRYLLMRDEVHPLELNVIDNYQAGEIRSTKNLSGGESFIVSLTLALGLSQMASRNVRVDSLFLDEGFGTLDEEALESALETLSGLHQDGKLIGVISHVPALKERISTQITIKPVSGGRSVLSGPGCSNIRQYNSRQ